MEQPIHNKTSDEAFSDLTSTEKSCLIDVRTTEELYTSGVPDLSNANKTVIFCEWRKQMLSKSTYNFVKELCCKVNITDIKTLCHFPSVIFTCFIGTIC